MSRNCACGWRQQILCTGGLTTLTTPVALPGAHRGVRGLSLGLPVHPLGSALTWGDPSGMQHDIDKDRIIWHNPGCRHSSMGSLVTSQAHVLWTTVAGFPSPRDQSKSKPHAPYLSIHPSATCAPDLWHAMPSTCFPCYKYWQKTMRHS